MSGYLAPHGADWQQRVVNGQRCDTCPLTERQFQIAVLAANGLRNKEIAYLLHISHQTIKNHLSEVYLSIDAADRVSLLLHMLEGGCVRVVQEG